MLAVLLFAVVTVPDVLLFPMVVFTVFVLPVVVLPVVLLPVVLETVPLTTVVVEFVPVLVVLFCAVVIGTAVELVVVLPCPLFVVPSTTFPFALPITTPVLVDKLSVPPLPRLTGPGVACTGPTATLLPVAPLPLVTVTGTDGAFTSIG